MRAKIPLNFSLTSSIKLALFISLSYATSPNFSPSPNHTASRQIPLSSVHPKATATDLLSLLGPADRPTNVDPVIAQDLWSCFRFLVPFHRTIPGSLSSVKRRSAVRINGQQRETDENELIWWPSQSVLELARLSVDSGGDPGVIHRALDPTIIPVPDVEGSKERKCELTRTPYGRRFIHKELNAYMRFLFELIVTRGPRVGLNVLLSRYDFFHGHLFLAKETGRLGILFHAKEYPAYDKQVFPLYTGYCQTGTNVTYDDEMNLRNILWLAPMPTNSSKGWDAPGVFVVLDASPEGIIYRDLIPSYVHIARTFYEDDLGEVVVDVNYLNVGIASPDYQIFLC